MSISVKSSLFMIDSLLGNNNNNNEPQIKSEPQLPLKKRVCSPVNFESAPNQQWQSPSTNAQHQALAHSTPELLQNYYALYASRMSAALSNNANKTQELNIFTNNLYTLRQNQLNSSGCSSASSSFASSMAHSPISLIGQSHKRHLDYSQVSESSSDLDMGEEDTENIPPMAKFRRIQSGREKKEWSCDVCHKIFDRPSLLQRHVRTHTGERPHACDVCGKAFSTSSSLNTHRRIHTGDKPHSCNICGKSFTASSNLYYHKLTHTTDKPHKCSQCPKSFSTPGDLRGHMHTHDGTWPFRCTICQRGFTKHTNLKNHLLTHTGDKPFSCDMCDKQFSLACNLKSHVKTHHADSSESGNASN